MRIVIESMPKDHMRYDTPGDWFERDGIMVIQVVDHLPDHEQFLIALHELVEARFCKLDGISAAQVDAFDFHHQGDNEPGDDVNCPYKEQHRKAMLVEHIVASFMGLADYGTIK